MSLSSVLLIEVLLAEPHLAAHQGLVYISEDVGQQAICPVTRIGNQDTVQLGYSYCLPAHGTHVSQLPPWRTSPGTLLIFLHMAPHGIHSYD
jgi:hypothetical protein